MNIVERLRNQALPDIYDEREVMHAPLLREAADVIERLHAALAEAISLRVKSYRNGDFDGDDDFLSDDQVARKEHYANKWLLAMTPNVEVQGRCAASSRSVTCNDGLGS